MAVVYSFRSQDGRIHGGVAANKTEARAAAAAFETRAKGRGSDAQELHIGGDMPIVIPLSVLLALPGATQNAILAALGLQLDPDP